MTSLSRYPWLEHPYRQLEQMYIRQKLHHGLFFTGLSGTGRFSLCKMFAAMLLCSANKPPKPCGVCEGCHLVVAGSHPDLLVIGEQLNEANIAIERIRHLAHELEQKPHQNHNRVVIIREAHRLNIAAANALLKSLEEPPEDTYILLTCSRPYRLPLTIRSRLQHYVVSIPKTNQSIEWLSQFVAVPRNTVELALAQVQGAPLAARELLQESRQPLRQALQAMVDHSCHGTASVNVLLANLTNFAPVEVLMTLESWLNDMIRYRLAGVSISAANTDLADWLMKLGAMLLVRQAYKLRDAIWQSMAMIEAQININTELLYIDYLQTMKTLWARK